MGIVLQQQHFTIANSKLCARLALAQFDKIWALALPRQGRWSTASDSGVQVFKCQRARVLRFAGFFVFMFSGVHVCTCLGSPDIIAKLLRIASPIEQ